MTLGFVLLALFTVVGAVAAMTLRNLVHCALALAVSFGGLAGIYLQLNAQFVGFAQVLVYIGAVAILILFAILLTRGTEPSGGSILSGGWLIGAVLASAVFLVLSGAALRSHFTRNSPVPVEPTVGQIGEALMGRYVLPLQIAGLLLTAAMLGAVVLAITQAARPGSAPDPKSGMGAPPQ